MLDICLIHSVFCPMGASTLFIDLCSTWEDIEKTNGRLEIESIFSAFIRKIFKEDPESISAALLLSSGSIYPQYESKELGIGENTIFSVVSETTGISVSTLKRLVSKTGDISQVAMKNRVGQLFISKRRLDTIDVLKRLREIAETTGKDSGTAKKNKMLRLLSLTSPLETKYLIRLFDGKIRIGLALQTILNSLGRSFSDVDETQQKHINILKEAYNKHPSIDGIIKIILKHGIEAVETICIIKPGMPLKPMLAHPVKNLTQALEKMASGGFISEYKYDGERIQIHNTGENIILFSRNMENISDKYTDIVKMEFPPENFILDGEVVAYENGKILPFQVLSTRKRKKRSLEDVKIQVCVFLFDIIYHDDKELIKLPLSERNRILVENFPEVEGKIKVATSEKNGSPEDIERQFQNALDGKCEGLMIKSLDSPYVPSYRSNFWLKIKKDYLDNIGDSLDLVVIGGYYGKGKRTNWFGGFLLGAYNDEIDKIETCCKIGTGFSDEDFKSIYGYLNEIITENTGKYLYSGKTLMPDVWFEPKYIWEVKAASLSKSPIYQAGFSEGRGISLRFPRFVRLRKDKTPETATTSRQLIELYAQDVESGDLDSDEFIL